MVKFFYGKCYENVCKEVQEFCDDNNVEYVEIVPKTDGVYAFVVKYNKKD